MIKNLKLYNAIIQMKKLRNIEFKKAKAKTEEIQEYDEALLYYYNVEIFDLAIECMEKIYKQEN